MVDMLCSIPVLCFGAATSPLRQTPTKTQSPPRRKISTRTRLRRRTPFWLSWVYRPPAAKAVVAPGDMVLLQGFDWELMSDRRKLYRLLEREMPVLEAAGIKNTCQKSRVNSPITLKREVLIEATSRCQCGVVSAAVLLRRRAGMLAKRAQ